MIYVSQTTFNMVVASIDMYAFRDFSSFILTERYRK